MCSGRVWEDRELGQAGECLEQGALSIWVRGAWADGRELGCAG